MTSDPSRRRRMHPAGLRAAALPVALATGLAAFALARPAAAWPTMQAPLPVLPGMMNPRNAGRPLGHWAGMLPDPGCEAVQTELALFTGIQAEAGSYVLTETCLGSSGGLAPRTSRGHWQGLRDTTVYQLDVLSPGDPGQGMDGVRNFQLQSDGSLRELDAQLRASGPRPGWRVLSRLP